MLLHGLAGSSDWWRRNVPDLSRRFRVLALDLPGFGGSQRPVEAFTLARFAVVVGEWLDALGVGRAAVVGHSMGAAVAVLVADARPALVERLILVSPAILPPLWRRGEPLAMKRTLGLRGLVAAWRESIRPLAFYPLVLRDSRRAGGDWIGRCAEAVFAADVWPRLAGVERPTLVVAGRRDTMIPLVVPRAVARRLPHGRLVVCPNAGHNLMFERPVVFNALANRFLSAEDQSLTSTVLPG